MKKLKEDLLNIIKHATEIDFDRLPNIVFARHLKNQLEEQTGSFGLLLTGILEDEIQDILSNININFSKLGSKCSKEDNEYLLELATISAKCIWRMYKELPDDLGSDIFIEHVRGFNFSLTDGKIEI